MKKYEIEQELLLQAHCGAEGPGLPPPPREYREFILPALAGLPSGDYVIMDPDSHVDPEQWALDHWVVSEESWTWDWEEDVTLGYGGLRLLTTEAGPGFWYDSGGSPMNGSRSTIVVPSGAKLPVSRD